MAKNHEVEESVVMVRDGALEPSEVCEVQADGAVLVASASGNHSARPALPGPYRLRPGDRVLVGFDRSGAAYVVGLLRALRPAEVLAETARGTTVTRVEHEGDSVIQVRAPSGDLVVEHFEDAGRTLVHGGGEAGVELLARRGPLVLSSDEDVRIEGQQGISLRSKERVKLETRTAKGSTQLVLDPELTHLRSPAVEVDTHRARVAARDLVHLAAEKIETRAVSIRQRAESLDLEVGQLVERARETYREVEELAQTRAGELRLVAMETLRALGKQVGIKAREDLKLRAEDKIYLD